MAKNTFQIYIFDKTEFIKTFQWWPVKAFGSSGVPWFVTTEEMWEYNTQLYDIWYFCDNQDPCCALQDCEAM